MGELYKRNSQIDPNHFVHEKFPNLNVSLWENCTRDFPKPNLIFMGARKTAKLKHIFMGELYKRNFQTWHFLYGRTQQLTVQDKTRTHSMARHRKSHALKEI